MKKYQNISNDLACVEFESHAQFLYKGQFVLCDEAVTRITTGIKVTDMTPVVEVPEVTSKPKPSPKKKRTKKSD